MTIRSQHARVVPLCVPSSNGSAVKTTCSTTQLLNWSYPDSKKRLPKHILSHQKPELILNQADLSTPFGMRDRAILEVLPNRPAKDGDCQPQVARPRQRPRHAHGPPGKREERPHDPNRGSGHPLD